MTFSKESSPETLEADMASLWQGQEDLEKTRACLFNLIVYTQSQINADYLNEQLPSLMEKFPCRVLFLHKCDNLSPDTLKVKVRMEWVGKTTGELVSCDFIDFQFSSDEQTKIPFLLLPHLLPDLPIYLLSSEVPTLDHATLTALQSIASRVIFDGSFMKDIARFTAHIHPKVLLNKPEYIDWNWVQLTGWREVIQQVIDTPERIKELKASKTLEITYNSHGILSSQNPDAQALYIVTWLGSCLEWTPKSMKADQLTFTFQDKEIIVKLIPQEKPNLNPGEIIQIDLSTWDNHWYLFLRQEHLYQVIVHISTLDSCEMPIALPLTHSNHGYRFWRDIFYQPISRHYLDTLEVMHTCATLKP